MATATPPTGPGETLAGRVARLLGHPAQPPRALPPVPPFARPAALLAHAEGLPLACWGVWADPFQHNAAHTADAFLAWLAWGPRNPSWQHNNPASPFRLARRWPHWLGEPLSRLANATDRATLANPAETVHGAWALLWLLAAVAGLVRPPLLEQLSNSPARWRRRDWLAALWHGWRTLRAANQ